MLLPGRRVQPVGGLPYDLDQFVVGNEAPCSRGREVHPQVLAEVLPVDGQSGLKLDFECGFPIEVVGEEVRSLPVVAQLDAVEPVVREQGSGFLEIVDFLLFPVQFVWVNALLAQFTTTQSGSVSQVECSKTTPP